MSYDDSIKALKGAERVRRRPGVMFGSDDLNGAFHTVKEIVGNSLDEASDGYGNKIDVTLCKDNSIVVRDYGRGVPMGWNKKENRYNWDLIYNELYAGGKYVDADYEFHIGLNGLGCAAVQYTSKWMVVDSFRNGVKTTKHFEGGYPVGELEEASTHEPNGTRVQWIIDTDVFPNTAIPFNSYIKYCKAQAHLNKVTIRLTNENTNTCLEFVGKGCESLLREHIGDDNIEDVFTYNTKVSGADAQHRGKHYTAACEIVIAITNDSSTHENLYYHNTADITSGVHPQAVDSAILGFFADVGREHSVRIQRSDYSGYLCLLVNSYSSITSFENQTKRGVSDLFIKDMIYEAVKEALNRAKAMQKQSVTDMVDNVVNAAIARQRAKEYEQNQRMLKKATSSRAKAEKLADCSCKDRSKCELFLVEGDSALGACKAARNSAYQAILPVRGKVLNCLKASVPVILKGLKSSVIGDLLSTIGTGADIGSIDMFDIDKLRYNKIIICTDADVDGYQIRVLLYAFFYRLMPELLRSGHVFVAETPLFEIVTSEGSKFTYTIHERDMVLHDCEARGVHVKEIMRSKGLGENDPEMLRETTMSPETRVLVPLDMDTSKRSVQVVTEALFGNDPLHVRKDCILNLLGSNMNKMTEIASSLGAFDAIDSDIEDDTSNDVDTVTTEDAG